MHTKVHILFTALLIVGCASTDAVSESPAPA
jgi:hypothetical protein